MKTQTWNIKATADGRVEIGLKGQPTLTITSADAGRLAAMLLETAKAGGSPDTTPQSGGPIDWLPIRPTTISLGSSPEPESHGLVFGFGPALLGLSLKRQQMKQIGEAMLALTAEGSAQ